MPDAVNDTFALPVPFALNEALAGDVLAHIKWVPAGGLTTLSVTCWPTAASVVEAVSDDPDPGLEGLNSFWQAYNNTKLVSKQVMPIKVLLLFIQYFL